MLNVTSMVIKCIILLVIAFYCQDNDAGISEIMACLPEGYYDDIKHYEKGWEIEDKKEYQPYHDYLDTMFRELSDDVPLPPEMQNKAKSITYGYRVDYELLRDENRDAIEKKQARLGKKRRAFIPVTFKNSNGEQTHVEIADVSDDLWVFKFEDVLALVTSSVNKGEMSKAEERHSEHLIYSYNVRNGSKYFGSITSSDYFIVANTKKALIDMIDSANGGTNILDSKSNSHIAEMLPELGPLWFYSSRVNSFTKQQLVVAEKLQAPKSYFEELSKKENEFPQHQFKYFQFGDKLSQEEISVYSEEKYAQEDYKERCDNYLEQRNRLKKMEKSKNAKERWGAKIFLAKIDNTAFSVDGKKMIKTQYWTKEFLQAKLVLGKR